MKTLEVLDKVLKGKRLEVSTQRLYAIALSSLAKYSEDWPVEAVVINEWVSQIEGKAEKVLVCSTGAMEKNIDVVIGGRFKKHGMSWTTEGANILST